MYLVFIQNFMVFLGDINWSRYFEADGNIPLPNIPQYMFIAPNMVDGDITLFENITGLSIDIAKGDITHFTIPVSRTQNQVMKFSAILKGNSTEPIYVNNQIGYIKDPSEVNLQTPLVIHKPSKLFC